MQVRTFPETVITAHCSQNSEGLVMEETENGCCLTRHIDFDSGRILGSTVDGIFLKRVGPNALSSMLMPMFMLMANGAYNVELIVEITVDDGITMPVIH